MPRHVRNDRVGAERAPTGAPTGEETARFAGLFESFTAQFAAASVRADRMVMRVRCDVRLACPHGRSRFTFRD